MKNLLFISILLISVFSCKKKDTSIKEVYNTSDASLIAQGNFSSNAHTTSGKVSVYNKAGSKTIVFQGFKTDSGPDLRVYLSKQLNNNDFVELGTLKGISGDFYYALDANTDIKTYKYVLIWCEDFSVLFGNVNLN